MSITSADCKQAITQHFAESLSKKIPEDLLNVNNWKRVTKRKVMMKWGPGWIRQFRNTKQPDKLLNVYATDRTIISIKDSVDPLIPMTKWVAGSKQSLKPFLRSIVKDLDYISPQCLASELPYASLPNAAEPDDPREREYYEEETVDFENSEVLEITDTTIRICAGGDWQSPVTFTCYLKDGEIHYDRKSVTPGFTLGYSRDEMLQVLYGTPNPPELAGKLGD